ncbi:glycosyltransferase [Aeromonas media]|uniref:glycosyltransferase n=1 Tax=Aeromonas media TaxID=651 RepID=UPI0022808508|nr:glycosyltransferase [Aeromonas media]MCY9835622.1 glycosyltransferase [Aeromonas media]
MLKLTEAEIIANWSTSEPIRVSVCCITYKQEQYIEQAIDSFLMQKTTFPFEIIIGEDCGGDGTLAILAEYKKKYPKLIKVITSKKNIGANANLLRVFNDAVGEYIAVCEGDDYWCDKDKLQIQYEYMEKNNECSFVVHPAYSKADNNILKSIWPCQSDTKFDVGFIMSAKGQFSPTSSYFFRKSIIYILPDWFSAAPVGDFYIEVFASSLGRCDNIERYMSVYRLSAENSWSESLKNDQSGLRIIDTYKSNIFYLNKLIGIFPNYEHCIKEKIAHAEYACAQGFLNAGDISGFRKHICNSKTTYWYDIFHVFFYFLRSSDYLVSLLYRIKKVLKIIFKRH